MKSLSLLIFVIVSVGSTAPAWSAPVDEIATHLNRQLQLKPPDFSKAVSKPSSPLVLNDPTGMKGLIVGEPDFVGAPVGPIPPNGLGFIISGSVLLGSGIIMFGVSIFALLSISYSAFLALVIAGVVVSVFGVPLLVLGIIQRVRYNRWALAPRPQTFRQPLPYNPDGSFRLRPVEASMPIFQF